MWGNWRRRQLLAGRVNRQPKWVGEVVWTEAWNAAHPVFPPFFSFSFRSFCCLPDSMHKGTGNIMKLGQNFPGTWSCGYQTFPGRSGQGFFSQFFFFLIQYVAWAWRDIWLGYWLPGLNMWWELSQNVNASFLDKSIFGNRVRVEQKNSRERERLLRVFSHHFSAFKLLSRPTRFKHLIE